MPKFKLTSEFEPRGDQPRAIDELVSGFSDEGKNLQTLLGVTGSGKTFTMAQVIQALGRPTLVMSHNKTLAAQLYSEFKEFFPRNAVAYFVSYYDYYQPEAYIPQHDIYIEKETSINENIDRLRLAATSALMSREDVIIVASVSCIFGLGSPEDYEQMTLRVKVGERHERDDILRGLVDIQYERNDYQPTRGHFRPRGDVIEVYPAYENQGLRIELFGDQVEKIILFDPISGEILDDKQDITIFPAKHFVMPEDRMQQAIEGIEQELEQRLAELKSQGKLLEAQRLEMRTKYDMEMLRETGYCQGIENYSRHLSGLPPGHRPSTLIDFFPDDFLMILDESHVTVPQIRGMFFGDRSRKQTLVDYGFRLPSALDNRPMTFNEFEAEMHRVLFVSATPAAYEMERCNGEVVEQIIRPTGLIDPEIEVRSATGQVKDLLEQARALAGKGERVLVTTLTKRMAEDLSEYFREEGMRCKYLHSEIDTLERVEILRDLRLGEFDVLVGVNLLREGLDLPEVSMVAILDADREGFLRSETSLIQMIGRCARNVNAKVLLYAETMTDSMKRAIDETNRRRIIQIQYNEEHGIQPQTIRKAIREGIEKEMDERRQVYEAIAESETQYVSLEQLKELEEEMHTAAENLEFERAAELRDRILKLKGQAIPPQAPPQHRRRKSSSRRRKKAKR